MFNPRCFFLFCFLFSRLVSARRAMGRTAYYSSASFRPYLSVYLYIHALLLVIWSIIMMHVFISVPSESGRQHSLIPTPRGFLSGKYPQRSFRGDGRTKTLFVVVNLSVFMYECTPRVCIMYENA